MGFLSNETLPCMMHGSTFRLIPITTSQQKKEKVSLCRIVNSDNHRHPQFPRQFEEEQKVWKFGISVNTVVLVWKEMEATLS